MEFIKSPNYTRGRGGKNIDYVVIHWFGIGTIDGAIQSFLNPARQASAHYLISDSRIVQMVDENDTAWHAGVFDINQRSIGIEHDANPDKSLSEESYQTSGQLIRGICSRYNIPIDLDHIKGHRDFKATQCPGTIDINKLITIAKGEPMATCEESLLACNKNYDACMKSKAKKNEEIDTLTEDNKTLEAKIADLETQLANGQDQIEELSKRPEKCPVCVPFNTEELSLGQLAGAFIRKLMNIK